MIFLVTKILRLEFANANAKAIYADKKELVGC
jgi:hypothetical protein